MKPLSLLCLLALPAFAATPTFKKHTLTREFVAEGAHFADFDKDGHNDICAGPYIWKGPEFKERIEAKIWNVPATDNFTMSHITSPCTTRWRAAR